MKTRAYCKVNLALDVVGVREDGYHDLRMIMVPVDFYDELEITVNDEMLYECKSRKIYFDDNNTIVKAIKLMKDEFNISDNFKVVLNKHIPMKAGLAGGSTDGAAVIRLINKMYDLKISKEKIKELCLKIGSDVLFTFYSRPSLVEGTGDKLKFIDIKDDYYVLIVKPRTGVSTSECYKKLDMSDCRHPDVDLILDKLVSGEEVKDLLMNSLEAPAIDLCKDIGDVKEKLLAAGADFAMVSGSGSSVFTIDKSKDKIESIYKALKDSGYFIRSAKILNKR